MPADAANLNSAPWEAANTLLGPLPEIRKAIIHERLRGTKGGR